MEEQEQENYPTPKFPKFPKPQTQPSGVDMDINHHEVCDPPTYAQATQPLNVDRAINVHQDIASILDKHIDTDSWRAPILKTFPPYTSNPSEPVQTKCKTCKNEIYTRVEEECRISCCERKSCERGKRCCDICFDRADDCISGIIFSLLCGCLVCCVCGLYNCGKNGSKIYRHFCPACNALIGELLF